MSVSEYSNNQKSDQGKPPLSLNEKQGDVTQDKKLSLNLTGLA